MDNLSAARGSPPTDLSAARRSAPLVPSEAVRLLPAASRFTLRGGPAVMTAAGAATGLKISDTPLRSVTQGDRVALWLGPDEQLLLTSLSDGEAMGQQLREALGALPHSLVDMSHRQIALEVSGPQAQDVLNAGCPLDLHIASFPVGMCTRTVLGKCDIVLWRTAVETFRVEVWRSFADYASRFLAEAGETL
jgi:sarcosine oxidase, subunit gamma